MRGATNIRAQARQDELYFNPRAPCGARRVCVCVISIHAPRAGRDESCAYTARYVMISIHAPRAGRDGTVVGQSLTTDISIHAPRAGRDE